MGKFIVGLIIGGLITFVVCCYHLLYTSDGFYFVPKQKPSIADTYVDIRNFGPQDWIDNRSVLIAIIAAKKEQVLGDSVTDDLIEQTNGLLEGLNPAKLLEN